jgi:biotin carboxylase
MVNPAKALVVGTTPDYIDYLRRAAPGRAVFLTQRTLRERARESPPAAAEETLCDLADYAAARRAILAHLARHALTVDGVACFDCESLELAALLAGELGLPFPTPEAIRTCRDKYLQKSAWRENGVPCPRADLVRTLEEMQAVVQKWNDALLVLKPTTGSGSELVCLCRTEGECVRALKEIQRGLDLRRSERLYCVVPADSLSVLVEECIQGVECSCDFLLEDGKVEIIRLTQKILASGGPFGTARAYLLRPELPDGVSLQDLRDTLKRGAESLGLTRALCMVDFVIKDGRIFLLEMTPRPGGDCLPALLLEATGLDMLLLALDFAQQRGLKRVNPVEIGGALGLRLHAERGGVVRRIDGDALRRDPRVSRLELIREPGHQVRMPPEDYDSWLLGHAIVRPAPNVPLARQCEEIHRKLELVFE